MTKENWIHWMAIDRDSGAIVRGPYRFILNNNGSWQSFEDFKERSQLFPNEFLYCWNEDNEET